MVVVHIFFLNSDSCLTGVQIAIIKGLYKKSYKIHKFKSLKLTKMATTNEIYQYRVVSIGSVLISIYGNLQLLFNWSKLSSEISVTPFLAFLIFIIIYWGFIYVTQILYLQSILNTSNQINDIQIVKISNNLIAFNLINFIWAFLFKYRYYLISEIVIIIEFFIILNHYLNYKTYSIKPTKTYLLINLPTGSLPLSWIFFQLFWNGSLMVHSMDLLPEYLPIFSFGII